MEVIFYGQQNRYHSRPSTSRDENLPSEYSKAENLGYKRDCAKYIRKCDFSLLDAVTTFV